MLNIKPYKMFQSVERYIGDVLYQLEKHCTGDIRVIIINTSTGNVITDRQVPYAEMKFVLHYQLNKRSHEYVYVEGCCLHQESEREKKLYKEYMRKHK